MADRPQDSLDVNELLGSFAAENAKQTQRAIVAEARCASKDRVIDELLERLSAQEALLTAHTEDGATGPAEGDEDDAQPVWADGEPADG